MSVPEPAFTVIAPAPVMLEAPGLVTLTVKLPRPDCRVCTPPVTLTVSAPSEPVMLSVPALSTSEPPPT